MQFHRETLDNGLEVIAESSDAAVSTSIGFFVGAGARDESDGLSGVSHFLEHMTFKGTEDLSADDINRQFDWMGASANAFTTEEDTVYYAAVLPDQQQKAVDLLGKMMRPALRKEDFDTEKLVILEEIRMYDDQPPFGADDRCRASFFGNHPLARSVLGTTDTIEALPVERMREYHRMRYTPENIVLAASGVVDFPDLVESAKHLCGTWERVSLPDRRHPPPVPTHSSTEAIVRDSASLEYVIRMSAGPSAADEERWAAKMLSLVLGDDSGSRLYWDLVDSGIAEHASLQHYDFLDAGVFATQISCAGDAAEKILLRTLELYQQAATHGIHEEEWQRARNKLSSRVVLAGERPRRRLFAIGLEWAHEKIYRSISDDLSIVESVSLDGLHDVLRRWPLDSHASTVLAGPETTSILPGMKPE